MNKPVSKKSIKSAQSTTKKKTPARSSRATTKKTQSNTKKKVPAKKTTTKTTSRKSKQEQSQAVLPVENTAAVQEKPASTKPNSSFRNNLLRVISLLAVIGITLYIYNIRDHVAEFEKFGYAGIFLIAIIANATVHLPAPGVAIVYAMGAVFNPLGVGLAAGTGGAIGEVSGYLAGFSGQAVIERTDIYERFKPWVDKYGGWAILVLSAIPNPFFDVAGIAAGISKMPMRTFLLFTWCGQIIKMTLFAVAGYYSIEWLTNFMR